MILLDTHVLVWLVQEPAKLGKQTVELIERANQERSLAISAITPWEIAMLACKDRLQLGQATTSWMATVVDKGPVRMVPITPGIATDAACLPGIIHGDPADCLVIATARAYGVPIVTADRKILDYAAAGHVQVSDARF